MDYHQFGKFANAVVWLEDMSGKCEIAEVQPFLDRIVADPNSVRAQVVAAIQAASGAGGEEINPDFAYHMLTNACDNLVGDAEIQQERLGGVVRVMRHAIDTPTLRKPLAATIGQYRARVDGIFNTIGTFLPPDLVRTFREVAAELDGLNSR